jgi:hypothetical protein
MAAPALICTKTVQDAVICFLWSEAMSAAYIYQRLHAHYGESVLSRSVFEWVQKFKEDRTSVMKTAGSPVHIHDDNIEGAHELILWNRVTLDNVTNHS